MRILSALSVVLVLSGVMSGKASAQGGDSKAVAGLPLQFSATARGQAGPTLGRSFGVNIRITAWTSPQQAHEYVTLLQEKGQDAMVKAMEKAPDVGNVAPVTSTGTPLSFATYTSKPNGGKHIVLVTVRYMSFGEVVNQTRSMSYPFGIVILDVDKNGKGTGTMAPRVKIKFNKDEQLEVENFGLQPFKLLGVYPQK
jgi:hypothetical protein